MATRRDVAKQAGVSEATVSYVINGTKHVTPEVRDRVLSAVRELRYQPNLVARSLATSKTRHVAMIVDNLENPYYCEILEGVQSVAYKNGYIVSVLSTQLSDMRSVLELTGRGVDGAILSVGGREMYEQVARCLRGRIPCIPDGDEVSADYKPGVFEMARCLKAHGHKRVAFLSSLPAREKENHRYQSFIEAVRAFGFLEDERLIVAADSFVRADPAAGARAMEELLSRGVDFTAVFALNDLMAIGAAKTLRQAGRSIPGDVSLVGCDNITILEAFSPSLSTLDTKAFTLGKALMGLLMETIEKKPPTTVKIAAKFIEKESIADAKGDG